MRVHALVLCGLVLACHRATAPPPTGCQRDDDCVISCGRADRCCPGSPCTTAIERAGKRDETRDCTQDEVAACPSGPRTPAVARCRQGACVAVVTAPKPAPQPIDLSALSRACGSDGDCVLVDNEPCNRCGCRDKPLAASEAGKLSAPACPDQVTIAPCSSCPPLVAACAIGTCIAKPASTSASGECANDGDCVVSCESRERCCPEVPCETVQPRAHVDEIAAFHRGRCAADVLAHCPQPVATTVAPRCRDGRCYGEFPRH